MDIQLNLHSLDQLSPDVAAVVLAFEGELTAPEVTRAAAARSEAAVRLDEMTGDLVGELAQRGEFAGKLHEVALVHRPAGLPSSRLWVVGAGSRAKLNAAELRKLAGFILRTVRQKGVRRAALLLESPFADAEHISAAVEGLLLGAYEPDVHKTDPNKGEKRVESFTVLAPGGEDVLQSALKRGRILADAQNFARTLANEPPNLLTPSALAEKAREMATLHGLECEVLDEARMRQLGMGSLLGVSQGSEQPPTLTILRYRPSSVRQGGPHLALVGKGVTFDTGGISIKPSEGMEQMKFDMCGAAAVIGAMQAIAQLKPHVPVSAYLPSVENMPGPKAQRPGDIVTTLSGKTVEVLNTDAEGRLILNDAITYAIREGCDHLVDVATLTGAIVVALGAVNVGVFANNEEWLQKLLSCARAEGEKMWPLPMDDDYSEMLKNPYADLPNIGSKGAGSITAAKFLEAFVEGKPWCHLDIAGTAWLTEGRPHLAKGPTGVAVRTMARLAMEL